MTARFNARGNRMPVTIIKADPNIILETKDTVAKIGAGTRKKVKKTENGYVKVAGFAPRFVKEVKLSKPESEEDKTVKVGNNLTVSIFTQGDIVKVTGTTKGRGFAGGVKRWGFAGGPKTHGQSDRHRAPGSIGQTTTPGRVYKGKKMAGHMGNNIKTVIGIGVVAVDEAKNQLLVKGPIPGPRNGFVIIEKTGRAKDPSVYELYEEVKPGKQTESLPEEVTAGEIEQISEGESKKTVLMGKNKVNSGNKTNGQLTAEIMEDKENAK